MEGTMLIVSPSLVRVFSLSRKRISSSFKYTFTKLRIFPSSVKRCFFNSENVPVRLPSASPTVAAVHSMLDCFPVNWRSGVGIITFTAIRSDLPLGASRTATLGCPLSPSRHLGDSQEWLSYQNRRTRRTNHYIGCAGGDSGFTREPQPCLPWPATRS